jgi:hypothetical protein
LAFQYGVEEMAFSFPRVEGSVKKNSDCIPLYEEAAHALRAVLERLYAAGKRATVEYMPSCYLATNSYEMMPDFPTLYKDASHDITIKPSDVEWHYPAVCADCTLRSQGCQGVDCHLPFPFRAGPLKSVTTLIT